MRSSQVAAKVWAAVGAVFCQEVMAVNQTALHGNSACFEVHSVLLLVQLLNALMIKHRGEYVFQKKKCCN